MSDSPYRRVSLQRQNIKSNTSVDEMSEDLKNDLLLAFNLYKNEENKINKLKLRTILFSFAWYKSAAKDINEFIADDFPKQEEFTYENLVKLVSRRVKNFKEREAEDLFAYINGGKGINLLNEKDFAKVFEVNSIDVSEREIFEMMNFMKTDKTANDFLVSKDEFKKFFIEK
jgi:hypothetical protein